MTEDRFKVYKPGRGGKKRAVPASKGKVDGLLKTSAECEAFAAQLLEPERHSSSETVLCEINGRKLIDLGVKASYLDARRIVKEKGLELPSYLELDYHLNGAPDKQLSNSTYPAWSKELVLYLAKDEAFQTKLAVSEIGFLDAESINWSINYNTLLNALPHFLSDEQNIAFFIHDAEFVEKAGKISVFPITIRAIPSFPEADHMLVLVGAVKFSKPSNTNTVSKDFQDSLRIMRRAEKGLRPIVIDSSIVAEEVDKNKTAIIRVDIDPNKKLNVVGFLPFPGL